MPYRSLKEADLRPMGQRNFRTVPRTALSLTLAAQVSLWGAIYVGSFTLLRALEKAIDNFGLTISQSMEMVLRAGDWIRTYRWTVLAMLVILFSVEVFYFYKSRPFVIRRRTWVLLMLFSLVIPFILFTLGSFALILEGLKLYTHMRT